MAAPGTLPDTLTINQVAWVAREAFLGIGTAVVGIGKVDEYAAIATAIAMAESGGNRKAHNNKPPDDSYGLWQINMIGTMGPRRRALFLITSNEALYDPVKNAQSMAKLWLNKGKQFTDWSTYKSGAYKKFLAAATAAVKSPQKVGDYSAEESQDTIPNPDPFGDFFKMLYNATIGPVLDFIKEIGLRIAGFVGGGVLLILAIVLYVKSAKK